MEDDLGSFDLQFAKFIVEAPLYSKLRIPVARVFKRGLGGGRHGTILIPAHTKIATEAPKEVQMACPDDRCKNQVTNLAVSTNDQLIFADEQQFVSVHYACKNCEQKAARYFLKAIKQPLGMAGLEGRAVACTDSQNRPHGSRISR